MNEQTKMYIPYGAAAIGGGLGWWLYGKFPKFGMVGKLIAVGSGVAGGYYISKMIIDKYDMKSFNNAVRGSGNVSDRCARYCAPFASIYEPTTGSCLCSQTRRTDSSKM